VFPAQPTPPTNADRFLPWLRDRLDKEKRAHKKFREMEPAAVAADMEDDDEEEGSGGGGEGEEEGAKGKEKKGSKEKKEKGEGSSSGKKTKRLSKLRTIQQVPCPEGTFLAGGAKHQVGAGFAAGAAFSFLWQNYIWCGRPPLSAWPGQTLTPSNRCLAQTLCLSRP
jgi:hypothetical protein